MKLWKISQNTNNNYDTYDSAIVAAETEEEARNIHPDGKWPKENYFGSWCNTPSEVEVKLIGEAIELTVPGVILASFNAG